MVYIQGQPKRDGHYFWDIKESFGGSSASKASGLYKEDRLR
ncbi:hypothetical protein UF75_0779 [Desulfosporosinus sp. I2]|nr:hypothetical protein UF75_0779 [Desulfosporosinus sp. I2]